MKMITNNAVIFIVASLLLVGCDKPTMQEDKNGVTNEKLSKFIGKVKDNIVFVPGGEFLMGDFGDSQFGMPIDPNSNSKPAHKIQLTSFSISKIKITNDEYQFYLSFNHISPRKVKASVKKMWDEMNQIPKNPANIDWNEANNYCTWLSRITKIPFHLPTEAQWEYVARSRGQFVTQATDNGKINITKLSDNNSKGINIPTDYDRNNFSKNNNTQLGIISSTPVDAYPPNPLGIYDMTANGFEWVNDWYDPTYYQHSPSDNPIGPANPIFKDQYGKFTKVVRSSDSFNGISGSVVERRYNDPQLSNDYFPGGYTARCVVNSPSPIDKL